jgi:3-deoxy-manno-octulosonate cytidylyltransferase (CMP-KDO synthetase)
MVSGARCGSERSYSYFLSDASFDYYVSIPSDEPYIDPEEVNKAWKVYSSLQRKKDSEITTLYTKFFNRDDLDSRLSCKIVSNENSEALYFSRQIIPTTKLEEDRVKIQLSTYKKHIGIFIFPREWMEHCARFLWDDRISDLASIESLEQNRFLEFGTTVKLLEIKHVAFGIDSPYQVKMLEDRLNMYKKRS